jgi:hypothetical protein
MRRSDAGDALHCHWLDSPTAWYLPPCEAGCGSSDLHALPSGRASGRVRLGLRPTARGRPEWGDDQVNGGRRCRASRCREVGGVDCLEGPLPEQRGCGTVWGRQALRQGRASSRRDGCLPPARSTGQTGWRVGHHVPWTSDPCRELSWGRGHRNLIRWSPSGRLGPDPARRRGAPGLMKPRSSPPSDYRHARTPTAPRIAEGTPPAVDELMRLYECF